ncbi:hypothetical protein BVC80_261g6 [Macleaya cordata]|uniref:Uncharacterized protein n=1 Tax=Macleaya cordata TaxID=56857 RepID=A0A200Q5F1_MACCD|nr:hypothetical protein BVC80_261g6 [Macleaya cordata]
MAGDSAPSVQEIAATTLDSSSSSSSSLQWAQFSHRVLIRNIISRPDGGVGLSGQKVTVSGGVKTGREQGKGSFAFLEPYDGSCELKKPAEGTKQNVELRVEKVLEVGPVDPAKHPLPKTRLTLKFLRDFIHLRPRTNTVGALFLF